MKTKTTRKPNTVTLYTAFEDGRVTANSLSKNFGSYDWHPTVKQAEKALSSPAKKFATITIETEASHAK